MTANNAAKARVAYDSNAIQACNCNCQSMIGEAFGCPAISQASYAMDATGKTKMPALAILPSRANSKVKIAMPSDTNDNAEKKCRSAPPNSLITMPCTNA